MTTMPTNKTNKGNHHLDSDISARFHRQIIVPDIGQEGQHRLMNSSVLIVGLGGLGCPVALYLAGAGIGRIGLADHDTVAETNLHRQLLFSYNNIGEAKVDAAFSRLSEIAPQTGFQTYPSGLTEKNAVEIVSNYDLIVDCTDNYTSRYLIESTCIQLHKPWIFGSISAYGGIATTFLPDGGTCYSDLFPDRDALFTRPPATAGVIGPTPGVVGSIEASEALRILSGNKPALAGKLLTINLLTMNFQLLNL